MTKGLSRRERQIMDVIYRRHDATIAQILDDLHDPPTDSSIRAILRIMEQKGLVEHDRQGPQNVYRATKPLAKARKSAVDHLLETFFGGSRRRAMAAMLEMDDLDLSEEELDALIDEVKKKKRKKSDAYRRKRKR